MVASILLAAMLSTQAQAMRVPAFQPKLNVRFQPAPPPGHVVRRGAAAPRMICGMPMVRQSADVDPKILLPARDAAVTTRSDEPQGCDARRAVPAKR